MSFFSFASQSSVFRCFPYNRLDRLFARLQPYWDRLTDDTVFIKSLLIIFHDHHQHHRSSIIDHQSHDRPNHPDGFK